MCRQVQYLNRWRASREGGRGMGGGSREGGERLDRAYLDLCQGSLQLGNFLLQLVQAVGMIQFQSLHLLHCSLILCLHPPHKHCPHHSSTYRYIGTENTSYIHLVYTLPPVHTFSFLFRTYIFVTHRHFFRCNTSVIAPHGKLLNVSDIQA